MQRIHRQNIHPFVAAALLAVCASPGSQAQTAATNTAAAAGHAPVANHGALSTTDREFIENAAQSAHAEVEAAQLALRKSTDPQVQHLAHQLIDDHMRTNQQLEQLARARGVQVPSDPSAMQQAKLALLKAADGDEFNRRFSEVMGVQAHHDAIELFRREATQGRDPQLKAFAQRTVATLQKHLQMSQQVHAHAMNENGDDQGMAVSSSGTSTTRNNVQKVSDDQLRDARQEVDGAVQVVQRMKADPRMTALLERAKGVFILPSYGRGALGVGVQGGEGVLVTRTAKGFSDPVFYNMGGISIGAQVGVSGGEVALLLMTDKAVQDFRSAKKFSLNADAGLTIVNYSRRAQASGGKVQDVIVWSGTKGVYAGASVGVTDVMVDKDANRAYYGGHDVAPAQILDGQVQNPRNNVLGMVLGA